MRRITLIAMISLLGAVSAACTTVTDPPPAAPTQPPPPAAPTSAPSAADRDPQVVTHTGLVGVEIGATRAELERDHGLRQHASDCAPRLPAHPSASPVFDGDQLVLLWADPPLRTSDGFAVGTPIEEVRARYPDAAELSAPADTHRYDGLLVTVAEHAYLFLHDHTQVRKLVVGYAQHAKRLFHDDFGTC